MVREARLRSVARSPHKCQAIQPPTGSQAPAAASASGPLARSQSSFGRVKVGSGQSPVTACSRSRPTARSSHASSPVVRLSYQAITGPTGEPARSSSTPASPMPPTATETIRPGRATPAVAWRSAAAAARQSSSASCSPSPGRAAGWAWAPRLPRPPARRSRR
jgi:hypothetical protein